MSATDWSRSAHTKRKLDLIDADEKQTKITNYFEVIDKISILARENKFLSELLTKAHNDKVSGGGSATDSVNVYYISY